MKTKKEITDRLKREKETDESLWKKFWEIPDDTPECERVRKGLLHQGEVIKVLEWILK